MDTPEEEQTAPSKTQRKRAMEALQELGKELVDLPADRMKRVEMPDDLREAVRATQRMTRHDEARRRQLQYVGRLMRDVDPEPIRRSLAVVRGDSVDETAKLHRIERLRSELLADEGVLYGIAEACPSVDLQRLRSLRRAALLEQTQGKAPRSYRALFQLLKEMDGATQAKSADEDHDNDDDQG
ncbi:ribosome biogenesis factor YjgA [Candidatus Accumulibacter sp. ACC003]|uniref:ribosome biogenesis factor YjgA n=1 Tax=Candidatus Accumulibacter sp. ACC003 TaxID=2823334 RepID=UPI0025C515C8|nr:ribosome biogenesis factor YjgA [Candidatus Accumulibacter sp. ACC003]